MTAEDVAEVVLFVLTGRAGCGSSRRRSGR